MIDKAMNLEEVKERDEREAKFYVDTAKTVLESNAQAIDRVVSTLKRYTEEAERMARDFRKQVANPSAKESDNWYVRDAARRLMGFIGNLTSGVAVDAGTLNQNECSACLNILLAARELGMLEEEAGE